MKKLYTVAAALLLAGLSFSSCEKDDPPPIISFKTSQGFTSADAVMARNTEVKMGINAAMSGDNDVLTKFTISKKTDNNNASTVLTKNLTGVDQETFSYDYIITTDDAASSNVYTFTIKTDDGLESQVSLRLEVQ